MLHSRQKRGGCTSTTVLLGKTVSISGEFHSVQDQKKFRMTHKIGNEVLGADRIPDDGRQLSIPRKKTTAWTANGDLKRRLKTGGRF